MLRPVVLELGGKSPNIVLEDAELDAAAKGVARGLFSGAGESCVAGSRIFVHASIFDDFVGRLVAIARSMAMGDPNDPDVAVGPLIHVAHRDRVHGFVERARAAGATILCGGTVPPETGGGAFYPPTLLTDVSHDSEICQEEVFGPVGVVIPFEDHTQLIGMANDVGFGLASGIWTRDLSRALRISRMIEAGTVWINTYKELSIATPFEGFKQSGMGREKGLQGMACYMRVKAVFWAE